MSSKIDHKIKNLNFIFRLNEFKSARWEWVLDPLIAAIRQLLTLEVAV